MTTRFHGVVFSYMLGKPVLGISVHPKISELMKDFRQDRFCIDAEALAFEILVERFKELEALKDDASAKIEQKTELNKRLLEQQYEDLLRL